VVGIVRENINFERGLDPKHSMEIGFMHKGLNLKKGDIFKIKKDFKTNSHNQLIDGPSYNKKFYKGDYLIIDDPGQKHDGHTTISFTAYIGTNRIRSNHDYFMWGTPAQFEERLEKIDRIEEAQNFERGMNPKKSMEIGQEVLDRKFIEETDWGLAPGFIKEYEIGELIKNYKGYSILIIWL
jgi:hypothetical protein